MKAIVYAGDASPWTCGDCRTAVECHEDFGHTEILVPIHVGDEIVAYMPWEPLAGAERQLELSAAISAVADLWRTP